MASSGAMSGASHWARCGACVGQATGHPEKVFRSSGKLGLQQRQLFRWSGKLQPTAEKTPFWASAGASSRQVPAGVWSSSRQRALPVTTTASTSKSTATWRTLRRPTRSLNAKFARQSHLVRCAGENNLRMSCALCWASDWTSIEHSTACDLCLLQSKRRSLAHRTEEEVGKRVRNCMSCVRLQKKVFHFFVGFHGCRAELRLVIVRSATTTRNKTYTGQ